MRRDQEYVGKKKRKMKKRGRPKRRFLDVVKEDMGEVGAKEQDGLEKDDTLWLP